MRILGYVCATPLIASLVACQTNQPVPEPVPAQQVVETPTPEQQWQEEKAAIVSRLSEDDRLNVQEPDDSSIYVQIHATTLFAFSGDKPSPELLAALDHIAETIREQNNIEILVSGHTDNTGSSQGNIALSERRAHSVAEYLINKGLPQVIHYEGHGSAKPIASNATREGRASNRRVDILLTRTGPASSN